MKSLRKMNELIDQLNNEVVNLKTEIHEELLTLNNVSKRSEHLIVLKPYSSFKDMEKVIIERVLKYNMNNQQETAKSLGIARSTLWRLMKEHGIEL